MATRMKGTEGMHRVKTLSRRDMHRFRVIAGNLKPNGFTKYAVLQILKEKRIPNWDEFLTAVSKAPQTTTKYSSRVVLLRINQEFEEMRFPYRFAHYSKAGRNAARLVIYRPHGKSSASGRPKRVEKLIDSKALVHTCNQGPGEDALLSQYYNASPANPAQAPKREDIMEIMRRRQQCRACYWDVPLPSHSAPRPSA